MTNVECPLARTGYAHGQTGLKIAEDIVTTRIWALLEVRAARAESPDSFPTYGPDDSAECAARRIVACLLDAGWRPPDADCLALAAEGPPGPDSARGGHDTV
ncbi:hypothetical protein [Streptomyces sp. YIM 121038]|uniref:hypothetical protein n=1 Tax=Streptomyces sp. YIM 121038 TaxID=2136401 RepID=UPI001110E1FE|nr:hypothetical protein [Streptomyces sp. YIM 121038]